MDNAPKMATTISKFFIRIEFPWRLLTNLPTQGSGMLMDKVHPSRWHRFLVNKCAGALALEQIHSRISRFRMPVLVLLMLTVTCSLTQLYAAALSPADAQRIGHKIWQNEC